MQINGFRNLNNFFIQFGNWKNLLYGSNGSGKTSIIEALYLLGFGKSFLQVSKKEMVNFNSSGFYLHAEINNSLGEVHLSASYDHKFKLLVNSNQCSLAEIGKHLYPLFFSSLNYNFFIDYIPYFRKMIDRFIFGINSIYLNHILRYNHLVKQKNYLLKKLGKPVGNSELDSWNKLLSEMGNEIVKKRMSFINQLNKEIKETFSSKLTVNYFPALLSKQEISESSFFNDLCLIKSSEMKCKRCLLGPHRDSYTLTLSDKKLQLFSSGEKKKHLMMVYLAFINLFYSSQNDFPVFLIDDYDVAMDEKNMGFIIDHFPRMQIIATSVLKNDKFGKTFQLVKEN